MELNRRTHVAQPSTHVSKRLEPVIDWLESVCCTHDRRLPDRWGTALGMTESIWSANVASLRMAQRRNRPVLLIPTVMNEPETARRLMLEPLGLSPFYFASLDLPVWYDRLMKIARELSEAPLHLWQPDPMERSRGDCFPHALRLACIRSGATTVVIDDPRRLRALWRHRRHPLLNLEQWSKTWKLEIIVRYDPARPKVKTPEA